MIEKETEKNKEAIRRLYIECINTGRLNLLEDIIDENYRAIGAGKGPGAFADSLRGILYAFPDIQFTIEDLIAEDNKVVVRWQWKGLHTNPFRGFEASLKEVINNGIAIYEFKGNKVIRSWLQNEKLEVLLQIGAVNV